MVYKKGKKNKLKVEDKVQAKPELVKWYVEHLNELNLVPGHTELMEKDYGDVANWLSHYLTKKMPVGKVLAYGAADIEPSKEDPNKWVDAKDLNNVYVEFKMRYGKYRTYVSERSLKKV
jgi:hypothetical protein